MGDLFLNINGATIHKVSLRLFLINNQIKKNIKNMKKHLKIGYLQQHNIADTKTNILRLAAGIKDLANRGAELVDRKSVV